MRGAAGVRTSREDMRSLSAILVFAFFAHRAGEHSGGSGTLNEGPASPRPTPPVPAHGTLINAPGWICRRKRVKALDFPNGESRRNGIRRGQPRQPLHERHDSRGMEQTTVGRRRWRPAESSTRTTTTAAGFSHERCHVASLAVDAFRRVSPPRLSAASIKANVLQTLPATWNGSPAGRIFTFNIKWCCRRTPTDGEGVAEPDDGTRSPLEIQCGSRA